jgi:hypothetical protein
MDDGAPSVLIGEFANAYLGSRSVMGAFEIKVGGGFATATRRGCCGPAIPRASRFTQGWALQRRQMDCLGRRSWNVRHAAERRLFRD